MHILLSGALGLDAAPRGRGGRRRRRRVGHVEVVDVDLRELALPLLDEPEMFRTLSGFLKGAAAVRGLRQAA